MTTPKTLEQMAEEYVPHQREHYENQYKRQEERIAELETLLGLEYDKVDHLRAALAPVAECGNCGGCQESAREALAERAKEIKW